MIKPDIRDELHRNLVEKLTGQVDDPEAVARELEEIADRHVVIIKESEAAIDRGELGESTPVSALRRKPKK